jgi:chromosome segregation ATPase
MPSEKSIKRASMDVATDETISPLDPRRFTPTLHANLVSEILALRRDQEEKTKHIESLESTLQTTREEHGTYQENLLTTAKENRSLKRQLALLESGTSSALGELARERDEAVDSVGDVKKRLEAAQRKVRNQEEDSQRMHDLWAQDKDSWEEERRKFERKIHVAESRLKVVLEEVEAFQTAQVNGMQNGHGHGHESDVEESGRENDAASV